MDLIGLRLNGRVIGVEPAHPEVVYANRDKVGEWEEVVLLTHPGDLFEVKFVAANKGFCVTPWGALETRPPGSWGEWEQFKVNVATKKLFQASTLPSFDIEGWSPFVVLPKLYRDGLEIREEGGKRHTIRGSTELLLAWRFDLAGPEAIREVLEERRKIGFNNLRVLWSKDIGNTGRSPWQMPIPKLKPFLSLAAEYALYIQGATLADQQIVCPDPIKQGQRVQDVRRATEGVTNLIEQLGNEYEKNGHDPWQFSRPADRLSANSSSTEGGKDAPYWDFFCFSGQRSPTNHAIREYGPLEFMYSDGRPWGGVPALCDEGFKPGVNSSEPRDWERAGAQARSGIGGRFHTVAGTAGNSAPFSSLERECGLAFIQGIGV